MASFLTPSHSWPMKFTQSWLIAGAGLPTRSLWLSHSTIEVFWTIKACMWMVMGLWAILASASIQLSDLNSFYLKHLGISLLLCSVAQILSILLLLVVIFIRLELWRRFLPSQLGLSYWVEDILHPRVMLQSFAGLVRATEVISQLAGISIKPLCFSFFFSLLFAESQCKSFYWL